MNTIYGKTSDIHELVQSLVESSESVCNEEYRGVVVEDANNMRDFIVETMTSHYGKMLDDEHGETFRGMLEEDAKMAGQIFLNTIQEQMNQKLLSETANPALVTLTASIATTMRTPYEATLHRMYDTRAIDKQTVDLEEVIPLVQAPGYAEEDMIDALSPYAKTPFVDKTELYLDDLATEGLVPGDACKNLHLTEGMDPLYHINSDMRVIGVEITKDGQVVDPSLVSLKRGSVPYFEAKDNILNVMYEVTDPTTGEITEYDLSAAIDWKSSVLKYLRGAAEITKVYFYATISHEEHTHPIKTSYTNNFRQFNVPTRPHIEVSMPQETRTDINNSIQHFSNVDIITAMTENISVISSRMEDQRLAKGLNSGCFYEAEWPFEAPQNFAYGNLEYFRREFVPFLDQIAVKMKCEYNIEDCHFRVAVSPYVLKILDTDYSMDKSLTEESRGSGVINYSIGVKTSTSTFYLISSQIMKDDRLKICLLPNNFKMSQVKTYNYFKYSSFLTDQIRRADNPKMAAIVYSERNLPMVFTPLSTDLTITGMPASRTEGSRFIRRV